jgi:hypothetical protein
VMFRAQESILKEFKERWRHPTTDPGMGKVGR